MATLQSDESCSLHPERGAGARCPSCGHFFCGECITEHEGRLICASCLAGGAGGAAGAAGATEAGRGGRRRLALPTIPFWALAQLLLAVLVCWLGFLFLAETIRNSPDLFHGGTVWE